VLDVLSVVTGEVEPAGERAVEQPRIREADHALLSSAAAPQAHRRLPTTPQEVALRKVDGADEAIHRREAAAQAEDARGAFGDLDVDDDPRLVGPRLRVDLDLLEVAEVHELLASPLFLLQRVQVALVEGDLTSQDLVLTPHVSADVDALHAHLGPLVDREGDRHARFLAVHRHIGRLDSGLDVAVVVIELDDPLDVLLEPLALNLAPEDEVLPLLRRERRLELTVREPLVAREPDPVDLDLAPLDDVEH